MEPTKEQIEQKAKEMCSNSSLHRSFFEGYGRLLIEMAEWVLSYGKPKPFDISKCEIGTRVVTRDGRTGRIICVDFKNPSGKCVIAAIGEHATKESIVLYFDTGRTCITLEDEYDLFLL